jgi:Protein of unknown function (DUF1349)
MEVHKRSLFFLSLAALLASAAPGAPIPGPKAAPSVWARGWGASDPLGDCRFERKAGRLSISLPGGQRHWLNFRDGRLDAPRLTRRAEGDFTLQVRAAVGLPPGEGDRQAGVVLLAGRRGAVLDLLACRADGERMQAVSGAFCGPGGADVDTPRPLEGGAAHLRLERRGQRVLMAYSPDGKTWKTVLDERCPFELPRAVEVGVFAACLAEGRFTATFDKLKFTQHPPAKKKR